MEEVNHATSQKGSPSRSFCGGKGYTVRSVANTRYQGTRWDWRVQRWLPCLGLSKHGYKVDIRWCHLLSSRIPRGGEQIQAVILSGIRVLWGIQMGMSSKQLEGWTCHSWGWCSSLPHLGFMLQILKGSISTSNVCSWSAEGSNSCLTNRDVKTEWNYIMRVNLSSTGWDF